MQPLTEKRCAVCNRPFHCHPDATAVCSPECAAKPNTETRNDAQAVITLGQTSQD